MQVAASRALTTVMRFGASPMLYWGRKRVFLIGGTDRFQAQSMPIRVAFNATPLLSPLTGIGNYIVHLGRALAEQGDVDPYSFYRYRWRHERPQPPRELGGGGPTLVQRVKTRVPFRGPLRQVVQRLGFCRGLRRHRIQVYHEQNYVPLAYDVPVVITVHDLRGPAILILTPRTAFAGSNADCPRHSHALR
jgi:hypothetical protein